MKKILNWAFISLSGVLFANEVLAVGNVAEVVAMQQQNVSVQEQNERYARHYKKSGSKEQTVQKSAKITGRAAGKSISISKVTIRGNKSISTCKLESVIAPYLKGSTAATEAVTIKNAIEGYYKKRGYLLPVAHVKIRENQATIQVIEGSIKDALIVFDGQNKSKQELKNSYLLKLIEDIETATPLRTKQLERYLLLINKIHGYKAEYELVPLDKPEGDEVAGIIIKISKERGKAGISVDNNGLKEIGKYEFTANLQQYNVISNDSLLINGGTTNKFNKFKMISGGYLKRITPYGTSLSVMGTYFQDDPYHTAGSKNSKSASVYGRFDQYLVLNNDYSVKLELKAEERDMVYYVGTAKTSDYKYAMGSVGGKVKIVDTLGSENWFYPYYNWTLNGVNYSSSSTNPINFNKNFGYFVVDWYRTQFIGDTFSFMIFGSYQGTNKKLPSEHLYSIHGPHTIKGYTSGLVSSNQGITGNLELRYNYSFKGNVTKFLETAQLFGFYGVTRFIAHNKNITQNPSNVSFDKSTLQAAGAGFRLFFPYKFYGEFLAAQPLTRHIVVNGIKTTSNTKYTFLVSKDFKW